MREVGLTRADDGAIWSYARDHDREADILYINKRPPYREQESEELGDEVIARLNPTTGEVENVEMCFFRRASCGATFRVVGYC